MFTDEELSWLYKDLPVNSTVMTKAVPYDKLKKLLGLRIFLRDIAELKLENIAHAGGDYADGFEMAKSIAAGALKELYPANKSGEGE